MIFPSTQEVLMAGRKIIDEQDARACLESLAQSGLAAADWGRKHGVDGRSLSAWRNNLKRRGPPEPHHLMEVVPVRGTPPSSPLCVVCGPFHIEVTPDFDSDTLARLLTTVASAC